MKLDDLQLWDERIVELVKKFGLNPYPQEFEISDHFEMLGYMAYSGMPSRYPHWSFGKSYEREKMMYDYGVGGLPYEMVINSNPCLAYLMRDNTDLLQILTIAHVYGHNDFFANNFTFRSGIDARYVLEMFSNHGDRVRSYMEDPSIGIDAVENVIDAAHALSLQRSRNYAVKKLSREEEQQQIWESSQIQDDPWREINPKQVYIQPNLDKLPLSPEQNILEFVAQHGPAMAPWQRDLIQIVDKESAYFIPQIETKIMNEGWASYWHYKLLHELKLDSGLHVEFLIRHNQVIRPTPGGINPYHLGFIIWHDIEKRWNEGNTGREYTSDKPEVDIKSINENDTPGRKKIFQVREVDRDVSFLRRFLTPEIMRELDIFQHEKRGKDRVITKVADEDNWESIKNTFLQNVGMGSIPTIHIIDADFGQNRTLYLKHEHDGRDLLIEYAEKTLQHIHTLWGREVVMETILNGRPSLLKIVDSALQISNL